MSTAQRPPGYDLLPFGDLIFDCEPEIGESQWRAEADPCLRPSGPGGWPGIPCTK